MERFGFVVNHKTWLVIWLDQIKQHIVFNSVSVSVNLLTHCAFIDLTGFLLSSFIFCYNTPWTFHCSEQIIILSEVVLASWLHFHIEADEPYRQGNTLKLSMLLFCCLLACHCPKRQINLQIIMTDMHLSIQIFSASFWLWSTFWEESLDWRKHITFPTSLVNTPEP